MGDLCGAEYDILTWLLFCWLLSCVKHSWSLPRPRNILLLGFHDTAPGLVFLHFPPPLSIFCPFLPGSVPLVCVSLASSPSGSGWVWARREVSADCRVGRGEVRDLLLQPPPILLQVWWWLVPEVRAPCCTPSQLRQARACWSLGEQPSWGFSDTAIPLRTVPP